MKNVSQYMSESKFIKAIRHLAKQKKKHKDDLNELCNANDQLCERLRDIKDISRHDNLRIYGLEEVENVLQDLFYDNLQLQNIKLKSAHRVGNKGKSKKIVKVLKFEGFKGKQNILSETRNLKGTNINISEDYSKEI